MTLSRGIYKIHNVGVPVAMDFGGPGSSDDGRKIFVWRSEDSEFNWNQLWLVEPVDGKTDTFTVRSLIAGTYMTLAGGKYMRYHPSSISIFFSGSSANETPITGGRRSSGSHVPRQEWIIKRSMDKDKESYKMKNYASGTFVDLYHGGSTNGTPIYGWKGDFKTHGQYSWHQYWTFKRGSLSSAEIKKIIIGNKFHLNKSPSYKSYQVDGEYLILPQNLWEEIWNCDSTGLRGKKRRREIFDYDDFALTMKAAVAQWGAKKCDTVDGFSIFCGLMLGRSQKSPREGRAYNFTISDDHSEVVFFDPQDNKFITESDKIDCNASHFYV
ncbi:hypothetical protein EV421DRAFT_495730 [Armillaria borealis]|uniref:Agglutinin C-terminal domain-containing protein n=1 Tax=Armillaria borealis TaxID=47425 RepID=A0AA39JK72_9AGAR|nr:hypothetical protein EV421DRAFT_495730 [Armillaria borealis]